MTRNLARRHTSLAGTLATVLTFVGSSAASAVVCDRGNSCGVIREGNSVVCFTPATPVLPTLWGELQPADSGNLPPERDNTNFNEFGTAYFNRNWYYGMDVENGWVLAGLTHGVAIFDARTTPQQPTFVTAKRYPPGNVGTFPFIPPGESSKIVFNAIDGPDDSVVAMSGYNGAGILVLSLADKAQPRAVYQNAGLEAEWIYATTLGGTRYAFFPGRPSGSSIPAGLYLYDLDRAVAANGCGEGGEFTGSCPGVNRGKLTTAFIPTYVHGAGNYVVVSAFQGVQILDVTTPTAPVSKLLTTSVGPVQGVALWNQGGTY